MNESGITRILRDHLGRVPGLVTLKISDRFTNAIPDLALIGWGRTIWLELKYVHSGREEACVYINKSKTQLELACDIQEAGGSILYLVWLAGIYSRGKEVLEVWRPRALRAYIRGDHEQKPAATMQGRDFDRLVDFLKELG